MEDRVDDRGGRAAFEGAAGGQHLVEHDAEREDVGARIQRVAERLLRRHVQDGADGGAQAGQGPEVAPLAALPVSSGDSIIAARPKSSSFASPRAVTKMFAGLRSRCTMPAACAASSASAICTPRPTTVPSDIGPARHHLEQRLPAQQLHDEVGRSVRLRRLADVVDRADVRMVQRRGRARLALEAPQVFFRRRERRRQQLHRDIAAELQIVRLVDLAHAAGADRRDDLEPADNPDASGE